MTRYKATSGEGRRSTCYAGTSTDCAVVRSLLRVLGAYRGRRRHSTVRATAATTCTNAGRGEFVIEPRLLVIGALPPAPGALPRELKIALPPLGAPLSILDRYCPYYCY